MFGFIFELGQDIRQSFRSIRSNPVSSAAVVVGWRRLVLCLAEHAEQAALLLPFALLVRVIVDAAH